MRILLLALLSFLSSSLLANLAVAQDTELQIIPVVPLKTAPSLDGSSQDWLDVPGVEIPLVYLSQPVQTKTVLFKAGVFKDQVYFYSEWEDSTEDIFHKPHVWDESKAKYVEGPQREDRFALEFAMSGDYDANWYSGKEFKADMWNWKAARTNPIQISHDKMTVISRSALPESYRASLPDGSFLYIQRPNDSNEEPYETKRYFKKQQDLMLKYIPREQLHKGTDDIKAKGVWSAGKWHLEQSRLLDTQQVDDVKFALGTSVKAAIAVFDHDDNERHFTSKTLVFQF
ncbi:MAG: hypothetical protein E6Q83_16050 [Thiothrix sp.]|nr:MAG: hypothetical protein E6Q83_16050 [Thiothrix sp.]